MAHGFLAGPGPSVSAAAGDTANGSLRRPATSVRSVVPPPAWLLSEEVC